jgi:poly(3-hydroxybutyrate) depolymerase
MEVMSVIDWNQKSKPRSMYMRRILMIAVAWAIGSSPLFAQSESIQVDGKSRDFIVYAPASGLPEHPALVLALHPLAVTNAMFRNMSKWDAIADREK